MKASLSWLKEYVDVEMSVTEIASALTMAGLEVETVCDRYAFMERVVVAHVLEVSPHENADKLRVCRVETGSGVRTIVCGAPNVAKGMRVALALPGAELPGGMTIAAGKIRGVLSEGMICSETELGVGDYKGGVMVLDDDLPIGTPLNQALSLFDPVIEVDLTPNRPDCLGIMGLAREISAVEKKTLKRPSVDLPERSDDSIDRYTNVTIHDPELCPRYAAALISGVTVGPSPFWLKDRLQSIGLKSINTIVDITNLVMMETGQPLHAFDFDHLAGRRIVVKRAGDQRTFVTLDGKERELQPDMLMICDGEKPVALAGVMGGLNSEIENTTTRVLIESAYFSPTSIRKTSKKLCLHSDASHRFERGVDPNGTLYALQRAAQLMVAVSGGRLMDGLIDVHPSPPKPVVIRLSIPATNRLLGISITLERVEGLLGSIEFQTEKVDDETLDVTVPFFRVDVTKPVDLMEEVARLFGYANIPTLFPLISAKSENWEPYIEKRAVIKTILLGLGLTETVNYSFIHERSCDRLRLASNDSRRNTVRILNPLTEDQSIMRPSLLPGLLETARRNISRQTTRLKIFETGKIFLGKNADIQPEEIEMAAGLMTGTREGIVWYSASQPVDFYDVKGVVETLVDTLHLKCTEFKKAAPDRAPFLRPGASAEIFIGEESLGFLGEAHPEVLAAYGIKQPVYLFELNLARMIPLIPVVKSSADTPRYPAVTRDITLILSKEAFAGHISDAILGLRDTLVETVHFFDLYEGPPIPEGKRSISIRITYRSQEKTLSDADINVIHQSITDALVKEFNATLPV